MGSENMQIDSMRGVSKIQILLLIISFCHGQRPPKLFQGKLSRPQQSNRNAKNIESSPKVKTSGDYEDYYYYDYYYDDPLPSGPTRPPAVASKKQKQVKFAEPEYDYYEEESLPVGPTRRPGQPMTGQPRPRHTLSPALNQFLNLPLLTTPRPRRVKPTKRIPKKKLLEKLGPFQQHFIAPPVVNAGALPLAHESDIPLNRFPPFNKPSKDKSEERR